MKVPVRIGSDRLAPALADEYRWDCAKHHAEGHKICREDCCGACYYLAPGAGCTLGSWKPVRCKTYPLVPQRDRVIIDRRCPDAKRFVANLQAGDERAIAVLEMAKGMSDLLATKGADDHSLEVQWMMEYVADGYNGPVLWSRGKAK